MRKIYEISRVGFEPALPEEPDLKSGALDHSANVIYGDERHRSFYLPHAKRALYHLSYVPLLTNRANRVNLSYYTYYIMGISLYSLKAKLNSFKSYIDTSY